MSGRNPYATNNGYSNSNAPGRYGNLYAQDNNSSTSSVNGYSTRERRPGGYGGLGLEANEESPQPPVSRTRYGFEQGAGYRRRPAQDSRDRDYSDSSRSRDRAAPSTNGVPAATAYSSRRGQGSMEDVLKYIQSEWPFMGGEECIPVQVALQLSDPSTLGLATREPEFQRAHFDLQKALKSIVNEHHQDFNSSIGTYHKIQASIQNSQSRVRYLKTALGEAKGGLLTTKPELKGLATSSQAFDDSLQLFTQIESIQAVPEQLEGRITEKRFLTAVDVLQEALRLVRKSEFDGIGAMTDLRTYFTNQEQSLTDILIEELHDHLYLKSPYCHDRWKSRTIEGEEKDSLSTLPTSAVNPWDKPVYQFLASLNTSTPMIEDASRNPEADTFYYIHMIIETLNKLGHLDTAVNRIEQRLPVELFKVVEKTNNEIDARYPGEARGLADREKKRIATPTDTHYGRGAVLSDFLWTVFAKFEAIAEGHRVVHDVVWGIVGREKLPKAARYTGGFKELWKLYQSEIRSLLHDYLATDGDTTLHSGFSTTDSVDVFGRKRDKNKRMFRLAEMDPMSPDIQGEQEDLDEILKSSVPGLISKTRAKAGMTSDAPRTVQESTAAGHKLLIEPSAFNVTLMLPPSLSFLQRLKEIVPSNADIPISTLTSFLDDFLVNVFHPQLEETVSELCTKCIIDLEAFTEDPQWSKHSPRPIFKGTVAFMSLIRSFSSMLDSIPQDQIFTQLIITQLVMYFDKCFGWYKVLTSRLSGPGQNTPSTKAAAAFAREGEVHEITTKLLDDSGDSTARSSLVDHEIQALLSATRANPLSAYDIISDPKSVASLSLLYNSMQWLSASLARLRHVEAASSMHPSSSSKVRRWTLVASLRPTHGRSKSNGGNSTPAYLPMTTESVIPFDKTLQEFRELAKVALLTLHIDVRCGVIHQMTRSLRGPNAPPIDQAPEPPPRDSAALAKTDSGLYHWILQQPPSAASALILELNNHLISFDTNASAYLGSKERKFITRGLGRLIDRILVADADRIEVMNAYGAQRMGLDILVLQQNLRNIAITASSTPGSDIISVDRDAGEDADVLLQKSAQFYDLFLQGAAKVVDYARAAKSRGDPVGYSYDELKVLVELCYSEGLRSAEREENLKAKKGLQDSLLGLGEVMWDS
ncbi:hypothetical protein EPUS_00319 [Endocarpon pusillum Z07020]|uniref:Exocyst complex component Sec8 n=1 Tax=Endocarpon pusillum (strain Z07020 / HMAS-L-300199) TaxID=1263415 RepID=U1FZ07_ENDPU|nr:uncharacterized protein EPUS_00319 [Endocarpon pusillum Z07020]ERF70132.1 hypothetical protein EPUS_00319 [Endocarpon pusillum Z07020]